MVAVSLADVLLAVILALGLHVNLSASAPRGAVPDGCWTADARGVGGGLCEPSERGPLTLARGYLGAASCAGGVQPVLKPVVGLAGDVVEIDQDAVTVSGQRLAGSSSAAPTLVGAR